MAILLLLHLTSCYPEIQLYFEIHSEIAGIHVSGLLTDRINDKLEKGNSTNEHALNREPVPNKHHGRYSKCDHLCQQDDVECISTAK